MAKRILLLSFFLLFLTLGWLTLAPKQSDPLVSPLVAILEPISNFLDPPKFQSQKAVYGFLPYWNIEQAQLRYPLLTHLAYFGLDFDAKGRVLTKLPDNTPEPGYRHLNSELLSRILRQSKSSGARNILVLRALNNDIIEALSNNPTARQTAIQQSLDLAKSKNFDGLNIDFEYTGSPSSLTKKNFSVFVQEISTACRLTIAGCVISLDIYADSIGSDHLWDFAALNPHVDHFIVMAYDFHRPSSTQAGPISPLRGSCQPRTFALTPTPSTNCLDYDISQSIADLSRLLPTSKLILGIPFYGYQWQTASTAFLANTFADTGHLASYKRIQEIINQKDLPRPIHRDERIFGVQTLWDDLTLTPRIVFKDSDQNIQQIYYENSRSLNLKYDLVNSASLGGIAIWALGYEGDAPDLWQLIQAKFFTLSK